MGRAASEQKAMRKRHEEAQQRAAEALEETRRVAKEEATALKKRLEAAAVSVRCSAENRDAGEGDCHARIAWSFGEHSFTIPRRTSRAVPGGIKVRQRPSDTQRESCSA